MPLGIQQVCHNFFHIQKNVFFFFFSIRPIYLFHFSSTHIFFFTEEKCSQVKYFFNKTNIPFPFLSHLKQILCSIKIKNSLSSPKSHTSNTTKDTFLFFLFFFFFFGGILKSIWIFILYLILNK